MTKTKTLPALADVGIGHTAYVRGSYLTAITLDHDASGWVGYHQADGCDDSEYRDNRRRFVAIVREAIEDGDYSLGDVEIHATQDENTWCAEILEDESDLSEYEARRTR